MSKETFTPGPENDTKTAETAGLRGKLQKLGRRAVALFGGAASSPSDVAPVATDRALTTDIAKELGINTGAAPEQGVKPNVTGNLEPMNIDDIPKDDAPTGEMPVVPGVESAEAQGNAPVEAPVAPPVKPPVYAVNHRPGGTPPSPVNHPPYVA